MKKLEGKAIEYEGKKIVLDEEPDEVDSKLFEDFWVVADGHDEDGDQYTVWWTKVMDAEDPFKWEIDFENPEKIEKHAHYELSGVFNVGDDEWGTNADGYRELAWELEQIDDNGPAYLTKIVTDGDIPSDIEDFILWKYKVSRSEDDGKTVFHIG